MRIRSMGSVANLSDLTDPTDPDAITPYVASLEKVAMTTL